MVQQQTISAEILDYDSIDTVVAQTPFGSVEVDDSWEVVGYFAPFEYFSRDAKETPDPTQLGSKEFSVYHHPERVYFPIKTISAGDKLSTYTPYIINGDQIFTILEFDTLASNAVGGDIEEVEKTAKICQSEVSTQGSVPSRDQETVLTKTIEKTVTSQEVESLLTLHL